MNTQNSPPRRALRWCATFCAWLAPLWAAQLSAQTYSQSFTQGQQTPDSSQVCSTWRSFQSNIQSNVTYDEVTLKGSNNETGFTCTGATANQICQYIRSDNRSNTSFTCDGHTWYLGGCGNGLEVNVDAGGICGCYSGNIGTVRPCIGNDNWGGVNGDTCSGTSQRLDVICGEASPNNPPVIAAIADQEDDEGQSITLQLSATDPEQNPITWSATGLPTGLSINTSTGLISGSLGPSAANDSPYSVTISANDGRASSQRSFTWTINDTLQIQAVTYSEGFIQGQQTPDNSQVCSVWRTFQSNIQSNVTYDEVTLKGSNNETGFTCTGATANDICQRIRSDNHSQVSFTCDGHTWFLGGCGNGLEVNVDAGGICNCNSGNIGTVRPCIGNDNWGGVNGGTCSGTSQRLDVICGESGPNQAPVLGALANQSHDEGASISLQLTANDPNGSNLTWSATGLPPGLSLNTSTGLISGTLSNLSSGNSPYTVNVTVSDGQLDDTGAFTWTVQDVPITTVRVLVLSPGLGDAQTVADALNNQNDIDIDADALSSNAVTLGQLQPYNAVLIFTNQSPSDPGPLGDALANYVDGGGGVVEAVFTQYSTSFDIEGRWDSQNYTLVNRTSDGIYTSGTLGTRQQPSHPILTGVNTLTASSYRTGTAALRPGAARVADYSDGQVLSAAREDKNGRVAWVGFFPVFGHSGDSLRLLANSLAWTAGQGQNNNQNQAPTLTSPQTQRAVEGATASLQLSATDPDGDPLTWSATNLPPGLTLNPTTGLISGNVAQGARANSPYAVTLSASDGALSANGAFSWIIYDDQAPTITWSAPAETWHSAQVNVTAAISEPGCDQDPTAQNDGGLTLALTGSQGSWSLSGTTNSGRYAPLQLSVTSACTGLTAQATRAFGVDPSAPQVLLTQLSQNGVDPMDSATWPGAGEFDLISLLMQARDPESGVAQLQVTLTDLDAMTTDTLHTQSFTTSGAPPMGPALAPVLACSAQDLCDNGRLQLSALDGARYALEVRLTNGAGAQTLDRRLFRRVGLVDAIVAWRQRSAATLSSQIPEAALALQRADDFFAVAVHSAQQGQWGSVTLTLQVAWASQRAAKALDPALDLDLSASPRDLVSRSFTQFLIQRSLALRGQGADADTLDTADGFLTDALQTTEAGTVLNLLANAWFWMEDAVDPMTADDYGQSRALLARIIDEMDDYITYEPALVGQALLADARGELGEVLALIQRVVTNGDITLSDLEHVRLLLGLTNTAEFLASAQNQGAWVRNWQWGLTQIVYIYAARGLNNAASILGTSNLVISDGYQSLDEAALYRDERMADDFMLLLINSRCLILSIYNFAYNPDEVPPQVCCEDMIRFSELDPRFPVPDLCANSAPSLTPLADRANTVGQTISLQPVATDDDNDPLTWSATGLPPGLSINPNTGLISGTINSGVGSPFTVTVTASDGFDEDLTTFSWVVQQGSMLGYLGSFIGGQNTPDSSQVCADWRAFQTSLQSNTTYTSVTLRGSNNPLGFTCTGATANQICQYLRSDNHDQNSFTCDGHTWYLGGCGNGLEVNVDAGGICGCYSGNIGTVRPCIGNNNWGGLNGGTCGGATQTLEVICQ
jgi:hypothetical protein